MTYEHAPRALRLTARLLPPRALGARIRWAFLVLAVLNSSVVVPLLIMSERSAVSRAVGVAAIAWLCWSWTVSYCRGSFSYPRVLAEAGAMFLAVVATGEPNAGQGGIYCAVFLLSLYGSLGRACLMAGAYLVAYVAAVIVAIETGGAPSGITPGSLLGELVPYVAVVGIARLVKATVTAYEQTLERERALFDAQRRSEDRFRCLVHNAADVILVLDGSGVVTMESPAVQRVLGHPHDSRLGCEVFDLVHPDDAPVLRSLFAQLLEAPGGEVQAEARMQHADGDWRVVEGVAKNLLGEPAVSAVVVNYRDVTERKVLAAQLTQQALHDPLTGLANRALFTDRLDQALTQEKGPVAVLLIDLDGFKAVNDTLGHAAGDQLLVTVAERLRSAVRAGDTVARLGGDEFAILITEGRATESEVQTVAARALAAFRQGVRLSGFHSPRGLPDGYPHSTPVAASIGATIAGPGSSREDVLRQADLALYAAKGSGKGRLEVYRAELHAEATRRLELEADLRLAVDRRELVLHYQPIFALDTGQLVGVEALLRWNHPHRGLINPDEFIPLAEQTGLILPIGRWLLKEACRRVASWQRQALTAAPLRLHVNLSACQFDDPHLFTAVEAAITTAGLAPNTLTLEITETALSRDPDAVSQQLRQLRLLGLQIALDDFGVGYSALSRLQDYPVDVLKIDKSFVHRLATVDPRGGALASAIIAMSRALQLATTAEGIETDEQRQHLIALGCTLGQGYHLSRPLNERALETLLTSETPLHLTGAEPVPPSTDPLKT